MTSPASYSELTSAIIALAEDDSDEFEAYLPTAIGLAEDRLFREVDIDFSKTDTITTSNTVDTVAKPSDYRVGHNLYVTVSGSKVRLLKRTEDFLYDYWPSTSSTGTPKYYAEKDVDYFLLKPTPNATLTITVEYEFKPLPLSDSNTTNLWTDLYPDLLFYAAMSNICEWQKDPERKAEWEAKLQGGLNSVNNEGRRSRQEDDNQKGRNTLTNA